MFQRFWFLVLMGCVVAVSAFGQGDAARNEFAVARNDDLRVNVYITASSVKKLAGKKALREEASSKIRRFGTSKVCLEVYRSGNVLSRGELERVRDYFVSQGYAVSGAIATTPGGDTGVRQEGPLTWFNWQNEKTQRDMTEIVANAAPLFDEFIIDDFLCTGDVSEESNSARGDRSWSDYRRDLMCDVSRNVFVEPARAANPDITMTIKYPQWYDLFQRHGYDLSRQPDIFDRVWVGTESRGMYTQRFGFMPPYESFTNYRWIASIANDNIGAAWFDHGDCDADDFVDQAYQSVLAGARELTLFSFGAIAKGHAGHEPFKEHYNRLADLARAVRQHPVVGVAAYKPVNSDAQYDINLIDFVGMLGVSIIPASTFPHDARSMFLPTQAAADPDIVTHVRAALERNATIVVTPGFLAAVPELQSVAGVNGFTDLSPTLADGIIQNDTLVTVKNGLNIAARFTTSSAETLLTAQKGDERTPFLTRNRVGEATVYVLNTYTYTQADFDAVGEVLLAPRSLGILELPREAANVIRDAFTGPLGYAFSAPPRVTLQVLENGDAVVQNYNEHPVNYTLTIPRTPANATIDGLTGQPIAFNGNTLESSLEPRSRIWISVLGADQQ